MKNKVQLTKDQLVKLAVTKDDDLQREFPGFKRSDLRSLKAKLPTIPETITADRELIKAKSSALNIGKKYNQLLSDYSKVETERNALLTLREQVLKQSTLNPIRVEIVKQHLLSAGQTGTLRKKCLKEISMG